MEIGAVVDEWTAYARKKRLFQRDVDLSEIIRASRSKVAVLSGVRRCGKSSLLMLIMIELESEAEKVAYVNLEDPRLTGEKDVLDGVLGHFGDEGYLLLDEITSVPGWDGWLARVHEMTKEDLHIIITSSRGTVREPSRPLRGRCVYFDVHPLTFHERLTFKKVKYEGTIVSNGIMDRQLSEHLRFGGFPEVVLQDDDMERTRTLLSYHREIVGLDIAAVTGTDPGMVDVFSKYLLRSPYFSATACTNFLKSMGYKVGKDKVLQLERAAAECMLYVFLNVHSFSIKDQNLFPRKAYAGDLGLYVVSSSEGDMGRRMENAVCLEMIKALRPGQQLHYWRDGQGAEVDLVVLSGLKVELAVQVCYDISDRGTLARELRGLERCQQDTGARKCVIITRDVSARYEIDRTVVDAIPLKEFLMGGIESEGDAVIRPVQRVVRRGRPRKDENR